MQAWKKRYLHNPLSFALEWFFSLPSYLLQQNYFLDFTHFNIEELDLTDQRFFWNRNVVNWRRTIFCYELYVFLSVVRSYVISRFLGEKKLVMLLPTQRVRRFYQEITSKGSKVHLDLYEEFWKLFDELFYNFFDHAYTEGKKLLIFLYKDCLINLKVIYFRRLIL